MTLTNGWLWVCVASLVAIPAFCKLVLGSRMRWMALGVLSWAIGVILKNVAFYLLTFLGEDLWPAILRASIAGFISAASELGMAAVFLRRANVTLRDAIGFGAGVGAFEILFVIGIGVLESIEENNGTISFAEAPFAFVTAYFFIERFFALVGHTASRVLIFQSQRQRTWMPAAIALTTFSIIDGLASYGMIANWNWDTANARFQVVVGSLAMLEVAAVVWFERGAVRIGG
jgi:hypothetical protein